MPEKINGWFKDNTGSFVALIVIGCGFGYLFAGPQADRAAVIALMAAVVGYYFGSSPGSHAKDDTISKLLDTPKLPGA